MSTISMNRLPPEDRDHPPVVTTLEDGRGTAGMWLFIITEGALFVMLFFSYFYLAKRGWLWPDQEAPKLPLALTMLAVLLSSSLVLEWGERRVKEARFHQGRRALLASILIGVVFVVLQVFEYRNHLKTLQPWTNSYSSIFYVLTSFHAAHVILGLLMLTYVLLLPELEPAQRSPHRPFHNAALYWHFVDFVWIWIVLVLYVSPHLR